MALSEQQACWAMAMSEQHAAAQSRCAALRHQTQRGPLLAVPVWLPVPPAAPAVGQLPPHWQACWAVAPSEQQACWTMAPSEQQACWVVAPSEQQACWAMALSEQQACWAVAMSEQHAAARSRCAALRYQTRRGLLLAVPVWLPAPPAASAMGQLPPLCWAVALPEQQACWAVALPEQQTRGGPLIAVPIWLPVPPAAYAPAPPCWQLPAAQPQMPPHWQACCQQTLERG